MNHYENFMRFLEQKECAPANSSDIQETRKGEWRDYNIAGHKANKKKGYYTFTIDGDFASGACGNRYDGITHQYWGKPERKLTDAERREYAKKLEADKKAVEKEKRERQEKAAIECRDLWKAAKACNEHEYLSRKDCDLSGLKIHDGSLLVPMFYDKKIVNIQAISDDGNKLFARHALLKGAYYPIASAEDDKDILYIVEGLATGDTVRKITGAIVIVAFNAGNLLQVAKDKRKEFPNAEIIIAGDNDHKTVLPNGQLYNAGFVKGKEAAKAVNGLFIAPDLSDDEPNKDWKDLEQELGIETTSSLFYDELSKARAALQESSFPVCLATSQESPSLTSFDWRAELQCKDDGKLIKGSLQNLILFLENHEFYAGRLKLNEFQSQIFVTGAMPYEDASSFKARKLNDNDITMLTAHVERFGLTSDFNKVIAAIKVVAENNKFNPAKDYFDNLKWDGKQRLKIWLSYYLGAESDEADYLEFIGTKWMVAAVKRVYEPACKFDHVLVSEGEQGKGKSTALEYLATFGEEEKETYFTDNIKISDIQNKDTILMLQGSIIVELAELSGFNKKDDDEIKGWITTKIDRCRPPYGRSIVDYPRQFVLSATTNNYEYLKDPTGNRRFWPFVSGAIDLKAIEKDRQQLWAEAVHLYKSGYDLWPTEREMELAKAAQKQRLMTDPWENDVKQAIDKLGIAQFDGFKVDDIMREMGMPLKERGQREMRRISAILKQLGYDSSPKRLNGKVSRLWIKGENDEI